MKFMKINWKVRFKNPVFYVQLIIAIFTPVLAYMGITIRDLTSWGAVLDVLHEAVFNPYILILAAANIWNAIIDPTTEGIRDSAAAIKYDEPKRSGK